MLSRLNFTLRPRLKLGSASLQGPNFAPVKWIHKRQIVGSSCPTSTLPMKKGGIGCLNSFQTYNRFLSSKEKLELDPKPEDENASDRESDLSANESKRPEDYTLHLTDEELQEVTGGDPELIKKVNYIQLEYELFRQEGVYVPSMVKKYRWKELLELHTQGQRKRFYVFLFKVEKKQEGDARRKIETRIRRQEELGPKLPQETDKYGMTYGLGMNTLFHRLYDTTTNKFYHNKIIQEWMFGRPLVYDLGYDEHMTPKEAKNCAKQLEMTISENRLHPQPFNITFCNAHKDLKVMQYLLKIIPTLYNDDYVINITEKSYLDLYPKENIVYLSPNAKEYLQEYDEDAVYIIGAMVDKSDPRPLSMAKAKKENLTLKKLPLDKYLDWGLGGKSLTLNQMNNIMLDIRYTKDWLKALRFVPNRKLRHENTDESGSPIRHEKRSEVYEDYELLNKRRGFQFKSRDRNNDRQGVDSRRDRYNNDNERAVNSRNKLRSIMADDD